MEDRDLTLPEAAGRLGVSVVTLRKLVHTGKIEAYTINPDAQRLAYRVTPAALQDYRERGRVAVRQEKVRS